MLSNNQLSLIVLNCAALCTSKGAPSLTLLCYQAGPRGRREHEFYETIRMEKEACAERQKASGLALACLGPEHKGYHYSPAPVHQIFNSSQSDSRLAQHALRLKLWQLNQEPWG